MDTSQPGTSRPLVVTLSARPGREEVERLCAELAAAPPAEVVCEAGALVPAGLAAVDALARLKLAAVRHGHRLRLHGAGPELRALLRLTGLEETLGLQP
ncbi:MULTISPECIES: STAS domain-containing protein [unclassified Streptomyces]|uniref:STAS domain-containing protein n=1 Tax=unclassified Streptomyces TaxID=2593676 RepID=UPI0033AEEFF0